MKTLLTIIILTMAACGTVTPKIPTDTVASWDGTNQTSGILMFLPDNSVVISSHARDRYNDFIKTYGNHFSPPLKADDGISRQMVFFSGGRATESFVLDPEHLAKFATMNRLKKSGQ